MELGGSFAHALEKMENLWGIHVTQEIIKQIRENVAYRWKWGNLTEKKDAVEKINKAKSQIFESILSNGLFWNICKMN